MSAHETGTIAFKITGYYANKLALHWLEYKIEKLNFLRR